MTDIANLVNYTQGYDVALRNPVSGDEIGITFTVTSLDAPEVTKANSLIESKRFKMMIEADDNKLSPEQIHALAAEAERAQIAASVIGWEWGGKSFAALGADPEFTPDNVRYVIDHPNAKWIRDQLAAKAASLANFTEPSKKPARNTSRK